MFFESTKISLWKKLITLSFVLIVTVISNKCYGNDNWKSLANMQQKVVQKNQLYQQIPIIHTQIRGKINSLIVSWNRLGAADKVKAREIINGSEKTLIEAANLIVHVDSNICGSYEKRFGDSSDICSKSRNIEREMTLMAQEREFFINYLNTGNCSKYSGFISKRVEEYSCSLLEAKQRHIVSMLHYGQRVRDKLTY